MPLISDTLAVRIILDLLQDRNVTNETPYNTLDKIAAPIALKYATSTANERGLGGTPTNEELATFLLKSLKQYLVGNHIHQKQLIDERAASTTAINIATAETITDLGT